MTSQLLTLYVLFWSIGGKPGPVHDLPECL